MTVGGGVAAGVCESSGSVVKSPMKARRVRARPPLPPPRETMDPHHPHEQSNLKDGLLGIAIAVVGLAIIMTIAHFWALG